MHPPKSDCKHKMVLQIGLFCIVWLFKLFISKMLTSSNIFFESFYFRKSHFLIRCSNPEFTFLNTDIFSNTLLPIFPTFFSNFTCFTQLPRSIAENKKNYPDWDLYRVFIWYLGSTQNFFQNISAREFWEIDQFVFSLC